MGQRSGWVKRPNFKTRLSGLPWSSQFLLISLPVKDAGGQSLTFKDPKKDDNSNSHAGWCLEGGCYVAFGFPYCSLKGTLASLDCVLWLDVHRLAVAWYEWAWPCVEVGSLQSNQVMRRPSWVAVGPIQSLLSLGAGGNSGSETHKRKNVTTVCRWTPGRTMYWQRLKGCVCKPEYTEIATLPERLGESVLAWGSQC